MAARAQGLGDHASEWTYRATQTGLALSLGLTFRGLMQAFLPDGARRPEQEEAKVLVERFRELLERDIENVRKGYYPRGLLFQFPYWTYLKRLPAGLAEFPRLARRRRRGGYQELPELAKDARYPKYYQRNFHWQTDGWFSRRSARLYDFEVELLFAGTADVMRRMAIPAVVDAGRGAIDVMDLGCGTGRFLRQLHAALPEARLTGLDLSPFYLKEASEVLEDVPSLSLVCANAEDTPLRDASFDVVTSIFMFHEVPRASRRAVAREAWRLLRPGGRFVVNDSAQMADSPELAPALEGFATTYHEPFYRDYARDPLEGVLEEAGFDVRSSEAHSVSKVVVGIKS